MADTQYLDLCESNDVKDLFDYGDGLEDADFMSTGLHGIQFSSDGEG